MPRTTPQSITTISTGGVRPESMLADLPVRVTRREAASLVSRFFFPTSHRTIERWPLRWRYIAGRSLVDTRELFAYAADRVAAAPAVKGGRQPAKEAA